MKLSPELQRQAQKRALDAEAEWAYHDRQARMLAARAEMLADAWNLDPHNGYEPRTEEDYV